MKKSKRSSYLLPGILGWAPSFVLAAFLLLFGTRYARPLHADDLPLPPNLETLEHYGCEISGSGQVSRAEGWAQHAGSAARHWSVAVSRRAGKHARLEALKDCDRWLDRVDRAVQRRK